MAKRFTDSEKWDDPFFLDMPNEFKLLYIYILDKCDAVGVWKINKRLAEFCIGKIEWDLFVSYMGQRIKIISDEKLWLTKFCSYQYGILDEDSKSPATKSHISRLKSHSLYIDYKKTIARDKVKAKAKEEVKAKVKVKEEESTFDKTLRDFEDMRKRIKKPLSDRAKELLLKKLQDLSTNPDTQIEILEQSIFNSWQSVFPLKQNNNQSYNPVDRMKELEEIGRQNG